MKARNTSFTFIDLFAGIVTGDEIVNRAMKEENVDTKLGVWSVRLTNSERMALIDLILEHLGRPGSSEYFDVIDGNTIRASDLLCALLKAQWIVKETEKWEKNT